jgi:hypothetical protein
MKRPTNLVQFVRALGFLRRPGNRDQFIRTHQFRARGRRRPGDGSALAPVEPPRGPLPLEGGAEAPLEFD